MATTRSSGRGVWARASLALLAGTIASALPGPAQAATPSTVAVEGRLMTVAGGPITDGKYAVTFLLYADEEVKAPSWSETAAALVVTSGVFQHALGSVKPLPALDATTASWLAVQVGQEPPLVRRPIHAAPYALRAAVADGANFTYAGAKTKGGPASDLACTGCVSVAEMAFDADLDLGGNALKVKKITTFDMVAGTVSANSFVGDGSKLTGIKLPTGKCKPGMVVVGLDGANQLICASSADSLPKDGLQQISNGVLSTEFKATFAGKSGIGLPDNNPIGIADSVLIPDLGTAKKLTVTVEVANSDLKTVNVILFDANKAQHVLFDKGVAGKSLKGTWPTPDKAVSGDLSKWWGANPKGIWTLKVIDTGFMNNTIDGAIVAWRIDVETLSDKQVQVNGGLLVNGAFRFPLAKTPPFACDAAHMGFSYLNSDDGELYVCRKPGWTAAMFRQCGNSVLEVGEDCDDGNDKDGDTCPATCKFTCGDGICTPAKGESFNSCKVDCPAAVDGQIVFKNLGSQSWVVPPGVTKISAVAVGAGGGGGGGTSGSSGGRGGGGGALVWGNDIPVTPGETLTIVVGAGGKQGVHAVNGTAGGYTELRRGGTVLMRANGGPAGPANSGVGVAGGQAAIGAFPFNKGGGNGGNTLNSDGCGGSGGGGAGGYSGVGGTGGKACNSGTPGKGGGGAGGDGSNGQTAGGGGGVGLLGVGADGKNDVAGNNNDGAAGGGGSGGANGVPGSGNNGGHGGLYGGGGGGSHDMAQGSGGNGAAGGMRVIWGAGRSFPSQAADK